MKKFISIIIILAIIIAAWVLYDLHKKKVENANMIETITVATTPVKVTEINEMFTTFGSMEAIQKVVVSSDADSRVTKIYFKNGQLVSKGTPIIQLDDSVAKADLATLKATLALAKRTYERHLQLFDVGAATKESLDQLLSEEKSDMIAVKNSEITLENLTLKSPFDGQLSAFTVNAGDYVAAGQALVTIVEKSPIRVAYSIPQSYSEKLKIGQKVIVEAKAIQHQSFTGELSYISPTVDPNTGTVSLEGTFANSDGLLAPGMFVQVQSILGRNRSALVIPEVSLLSDIQGNYVYTVKNSKALRINITIGNIQEGDVQVLKGLSKDQEIISEGQQKLSDGDPVTVVDSTV